MRIAMVGTRGIPASYSGFETCVEQLGSRLVKRGHEVTVYCRAHHISYPGSEYRGMRLVKLPSIQRKHLDTIVHTLLSVLHAVRRPFDLVLMFIVGNSPLAAVPRLGGQKVVLNVDGLDWKRAKWGAWARGYLRLAEFLAARIPHAIITDSRSVEAYYVARYGAPSTYIAYGADVEWAPPGEHLSRYGLRPRGYILFVGRLVPENCVHHLLDAFDGLRTDLKCVIVGDAPYAEAYIRRLRGTRNPNVVFTGYLFGEGYRELGSNAYCFVEPSEVGGTHPALIEAMAFGNCVVVNDTPSNLEAMGEAGLAYNGHAGAESLRGTLQWLIDHPERLEGYRRPAKARAESCYSWDAVTEQYERLFAALLSRSGH
jgi:glycosyltransferase involved in cell wall biosynthesis